MFSRQIGTFTLGVAVLACAAAPAAYARAAKPVAQSVRLVRSTAELTQALADARKARVQTIRLAAGRYTLGAPIVIDAALSGTPAAPFTIEAAAGARVELTGARDLPKLSWELQADGVWRAPLKTRPFMRLWLGDRGLILARYPDYDPAKSPFGGVSAGATSAERVARWSNPDGAVLHALHGSRWGDVHVPILGKNPDGTLRFGSAVGNNRAAPPSVNERFVENVREELDSPAEWYYDQNAGYLYFKPEGDGPPPATGFRAGESEELIRVVGKPGAPVHDIRVSGLAFRGTEPTYMKTTEPLLRSDWMFHRGGAVLIADADRVTVEGSDFKDLGGNAIVVSGHARQVVIRRNLIARIGASAIAFVGLPTAVRTPLLEYSENAPLDSIDRTPGPKTDDYPADSIAEDNLIHDIGLVEKQSAGVQIAMSARITVNHNSIYRVPRAGINVGDGTWGGHQITNNDVFDTVRESGDHGAYNSWGRDRFWHSDRAEMDRRTMADRSLVKLDVRETIVLRHNRFHCDHGWDVDLDDGSSNYLIEDNLMLTGGLKFREGFDRTARNNIMLNNTFHPHVWFANSEDVFTRNIVMAAYQPILMKSWGKLVDYNFFATAADLKLAQENGTDSHSLAGNPKFVAPARGNYSVAADSPALRIGFRNFRMDDFGVRDPRLRAMAERPKLPEPVLAPAANQLETPRTFARMTVKSVQTLGEQSAAGLPDISGVLVLTVEPGSGAAAAGLKSGDVIRAIVGSPEAPGQDVKTAAAFITAAQGRRWQGSIIVDVFRNQRSQRLTLSLH